MARWWDRLSTGKRWAAAGPIDPPTDIQAQQGFSYMGQGTPTDAQHNALFQWHDDANIWTFELIRRAIAVGGETATETDLDALAELIRAIKGGEVTYATPGSGTFTVPRLATTLTVEGWGGGGSGGSTAGTPNSASSAGGGGGYFKRNLAVTPGQVIAWTVGAGGASPPSGPNNGLPGGNTTFGPTLIAYGGGGGFAADGAPQGAPSTGGNATGGDPNIPGSGGGLAYPIGGGAYVLAVGGSAYTATQTPPITGAVAVSGASGNFPGGGGGGALLSGVGGPGAKGFLRVRWQ